MGTAFYRDTPGAVGADTGKIGTSGHRIHTVAAYVVVHSQMGDICWL